jgi:hypothetical protein
VEFEILRDSSHSLENSLWNVLWTSIKTDYPVTIYFTGCPEYSSSYSDRLRVGESGVRRPVRERLFQRSQIYSEGQPTSFKFGNEALFPRAFMTHCRANFTLTIFSLYNEGYKSIMYVCGRIRIDLRILNENLRA